jgi:hypothetical protein
MIVIWEEERGQWLTCLVYNIATEHTRRGWRGGRWADTYSIGQLQNWPQLRYLIGSILDRFCIRYVLSKICLESDKFRIKEACSQIGPEVDQLRIS